MTKILFSTLLLLPAFFDWGQTVSYDFSQPLSPSGISVDHVSTSYFGSYTLDDRTFIFNEDGIQSKTTIYLSISRETIRENSKYVVKNGYLFGVKKMDSIPCFLNGEKYYYGLREEIELVGTSSLNKLIDDGNSYYINFYEDGTWIPAKISFKSNTLTLSYFDYPEGTTVFNSINLKTEKEEDGLRKITLWPTEKEWETLDKTVIFPTEMIFTKQQN